MEKPPRSWGRGAVLWNFLSDPVPAEEPHRQQRGEQLGQGHGPPDSGEGEGGGQQEQQHGGQRYAAGQGDGHRGDRAHQRLEVVAGHHVDSHQQE